MIINTWRRTSSVTFTDRTSPRCEWGEVIFCHRMAHFVLIRCYLQPSLAEALCIYNFFSIRDRPHTLRGASVERCCLSPHGALRAYTVFPTAEPRRGSLHIYFFSIRDRPHVADVRVWSGVLCHRMAHFVLIRCFPQPKVSDFLLFLWFKDE